MCLIETPKELMHSKLTIIYNETNRFSYICPERSSLCEKRENLLLLPWEEDFVLRNEKTSIKFHRNYQERYCIELIHLQCPWLNKKGLCIIYPKRPFDCRSFPIVPRFSLKPKRVEFFLSPYCPIVNKLPKDFIKTIIRSWMSIEKYLPSEWKTLYNSLNEYTYNKKAKICDLHRPI